jgi:signal transduction histidine kinase
MSEAYIVPFFVFGTLTFVLLLVAILVMMMINNKRRYEYVSEKKEREYQYKNELLNAQIELQEHLLSQVSREIHDNVGQVLSLVKVHLFSISTQMTDGKAIGLIETSSELLDKAIEDLRSISHTQNADLVLRTGLKEAIGKELKYLEELKKQKCILEITGEQYYIPADKELLLYRIAQEAIHNSIKHAKCNELQVCLNYDERLFTLTIADNGQGFDTTNESINYGIGISHMQYRAKILSAELKIYSKIQQGTTVTLTMPILPL